MNVLVRYRKSFLAKAAALGFIYLIVLGNIWLSFVVIAHQPPTWVYQGLLGGVVYIVLQLVGFVVYCLRDLLLKPNQDQ